MTVSLPPDEYEEFIDREGKEFEKLSRKERKLSERIRKRDDQEFREENPILQFIALLFYKLLTFVGFLWLLAGFANIYFVYQVYSVCKVSGIHGIIETKWSLYIIAYIIIYTILSKVRFSFYRYTRE